MEPKFPLPPIELLLDIFVSINRMLNDQALIARVDKEYREAMLSENHMPLDWWRDPVEKDPKS